MKRVKLLILFCLLTCVTFGQGTNYYFSSSEGNDANTGTSPGSPLASITMLNSLTLQPGDQVHFKRGDTFIGQVVCGYSGSEGAPIVYTAYGSGPLPILSGSSGDSSDDIYDPVSTFLIVDKSFLEFKELHIRNERFDAKESDDEFSFGILCYSQQSELGPHVLGKSRSLPGVYKDDARQFEEAVINTPSLNFNEHIYFSDLYFDKIYAARTSGIEFNQLRSTAIYFEESFTKDIIVENSYFTDLQRTGFWTRRWAADVIVRNNEFVNIGGSGTILSTSNRILYEGNKMLFNGSNSDFRMAKRGSGMWVFACDGVVAQHNVSKHARGPNDSSGMHVDYSNSNILYQYNYSEDAAGGFCETLGDNVNVIWRYNISVNDGENSGKNRILWVNPYAGWKGSIKSKELYYYNNTIFAGRDYDNEITDSEVLLEAEDMTFYNNILYLENGSRLGKKKYNEDLDTHDFKKNIYFGGQFKQALLNLETGEITDDPMFIGAGTDNELGYVLAEGSPALGAAETFVEPVFPYAGQGIFANITSAATKDYYGNPVDLTQPTHIGAYNGPASTFSMNTDTYEAEDAAGNGSSCTNASGNSVVDVSAGSVTFNVTVPEAGAYILDVYYLNPSVNEIGIRINGGDEEQVLFQLTKGTCAQNGNPGNYQLIRDLSAGSNTIELSSLVVDRLDVISFIEGGITPPPPAGPIYEAEEAELFGSVKVAYCEPSDITLVSQISAGSGNAVSFSVTADVTGDYDVTVTYFANTEKNMTYELNGAAAQTVTVDPSGDWCYLGGSAADTTLTLSLVAGINTLLFYDSPVLDKIEVVEAGGVTPPPFTPLELEAELAVLSGSASIGNCQFASGTGLVKNINGGVGNAVTFEDISVPQSAVFNVTVSYYSLLGGTFEWQLNSDAPQTETVMSSDNIWCYQGGDAGVHEFQVTMPAGLNDLTFFDSPVLDKILIEEVGVVPPPPFTPLELEAELAVISGSASIGNCQFASGTGLVKNINGGVGNAVIFEDISVPQSAVFNVTVSYYSLLGGTFEWQLNSDAPQTETVMSSDNIWCYQGGDAGVHEFQVTMPAGLNDLTFFDSPVLDKILIEEVGVVPPPPFTPLELEAELAVLSGSASIGNCQFASGTELVKNINGGVGNAVTFAGISVPQSATFDVIVTYYSLNGGSLNYQLNNDAPQSTTVSSSGNTFCYQGGESSEIPLTIVMPAGLNDITFFDSPNLDKIKISLSGSSARPAGTVLGVSKDAPLKVYPTIMKSGERYSIEFPALNRDYSGLSVNFLDLSGRVHHTEEIITNDSKIQLSVPQISSGIYIIQILGEKVLSEQRVIVK